MASPEVAPSIPTQKDAACVSDDEAAVGVTEGRVKVAAT